MTRTVPEAHAELLTADDVHQDVRSLTASLQRRQAEQHAYAVLSRPEVSGMLKTLIANGTGS